MLFDVSLNAKRVGTGLRLVVDPLNLVGNCIDLPYFMGWLLCNQRSSGNTNQQADLTATRGKGVFT